ncbi:PREDICTED: uncharacterized protein LOC109149130 [Ipomoea nil]|uniref:uncharacterized protein LOC109149130 n=1 Tax=Ipomoea nil TaxID=35883 RepID=UPI0009010DC8|nr:PREDICTED: uncharacterized protein LOC109149130 [Ipomoea nil]
MAHNTTHRRSLAASMDPTLKRHQQQQPKSSTTAHPHPDPTLASSATIQCISKHFSNLYSNHKQRLSASSKASVDAHLDSSCPALTKSKSQHGRNFHREGAPIKKSHKHPDFVKRSNDEIKKASKKEEPDLEGIDVKRAYGSLSGSEELKKIQKQVVKYEEEEEEVKRPSLSLEMGGGGRRRSFSSSQIELADFFSCNSVKVVSVDMPPFMQIHAVDCARKVYDSLEKFTSKALALSLKKEFDGVYGPAWHCIVGTSFGSFVTHSVGGFIYFSMDHKLYVLLFKTTVQRAD